MLVRSGVRVADATRGAEKCAQEKQRSCAVFLAGFSGGCGSVSAGSHPRSNTLWLLQGCVAYKTFRMETVHQFTMAFSLRAPPVLSNTGYPTLAASDPPAYGALNPRPDAAALQANSSGVPSGGLFGEHVTSNADASLFQPNIAPDVVTVAVRVPTAYFGTSGTSLHVPKGTVVCLAPHNARAQGRWHASLRSKSEDTGAIHTAYFGKFPGMVDFTRWSETDRSAYQKTLQSASMLTVTVGPATISLAHAGGRCKTAYIAVAVQNVAHVSYANIDAALREHASIGQKMYFACTPDSLPHVSEAPNAHTPTRELTLMLPLDLPRLGTATFDVGSHIFR